LCNVAQCFNSMGLVVRDASITTNPDDKIVSDVFVIQDQRGNQIAKVSNELVTNTARAHAAFRLKAPES
jgi:UTP:GlnB (protein PII) uridylyltransferase